MSEPGKTVDIVEWYNLFVITVISHHLSTVVNDAPSAIYGPDLRTYGVVFDL